MLCKFSERFKFKSMDETDSFECCFMEAIYYFIFLHNFYLPRCKIFKRSLKELQDGIENFGVFGASIKTFRNLVRPANFFAIISPIFSLTPETQQIIGSKAIR